MNFIQAHEVDIAKLNTLMRRSKGYWGYSNDFLNKFMDHFKLTKKYLLSSTVRIMRNENEYIGFLSFKNCNSDQFELDCFFVDPTYIGKGYGRTLWQHALDVAHSLGKEEFILWSDPGAESFYKKMGCIKIGMRKSPLLPDRECPLMRFCSLGD